MNRFDLRGDYMDRFDLIEVTLFCSVLVDTMLLSL
jgi:hypothetical protein